MCNSCIHWRPFEMFCVLVVGSVDDGLSYGVLYHSHSGLLSKRVPYHSVQQYLIPVFDFVRFAGGRFLLVESSQKFV